MDSDPYRRPAFSLENRALRVLWNIVYRFAFRTSPRILFGWRVVLLRLFGARLGPRCSIYPKCEIWAPWNLVCAADVAIADGAIIYNPSVVTLGSHSIISQNAYLCGASHDLDDPAFPLFSAPITLGAYAWVAARASVLPGVKLGDYAVLGLGSVATRDLDAGGIYVGVPARYIRQRRVAARVDEQTEQGVV